MTKLELEKIIDANTESLENYSAIIDGINDYLAASKLNISMSFCKCSNSEKEKSSSIPVYCNNCNAYVQNSQ